MGTASHEEVPVMLGLRTAIYHVADLDRAKAAVQDGGGGIKVATVSDPFGNLIGLIENPNFRAAAA